jgi:hypothetical protein
MHRKGVFLNFAAIIILSMEFLRAGQVPFDQVYSDKIDLVIGVSGYERRSPYLVERMKLGNEIKVVLAFEERKDEMNRPDNDRIFQDLGFRFIHESGDSCPDMGRIFSLIPQVTGDSVTLLVDYSCMTKLWYSSVINHLITSQLPFRKVSVLFSYTTSEFVEPKKPKPLKVAEPLGCAHMGLAPGKPLALVMGLGYEKQRAEFLKKSVDPDTTYCFYADPVQDERYIEKVYLNNFKLIDSLHKDHVFPYPIRDMDRTDQLLTSLCLDLRMKYRIILAPLGPKPFALISMLLAARYPDIEVWRVSAGKMESSYDRVPVGEPQIYRVEFGSEQVEYPRE